MRKEFRNGITTSELKHHIKKTFDNPLNLGISLKDLVEGTLEEFKSDYVNTVDAFSFYALTSLKKVVLNSAKKIEKYAFNGCTALEILVLGNEIEICTLENTNALTNTLIASGTGSIYVPSHLLTAYKEDEMWSAYASCFKTFGEVEQFANGKETELYDESIETIRTGCFTESKALISVNFPNLIAVGNTAFKNCSNLERVSFPHATSVGTQGFRNCVKLKSIDMPNITSLGNYSFSWCSALESISFPLLTETSAGGCAFSSCISLKNIDLPLLSTIYDGDFSNIGAEQICLPSLSTHNRRAFQDCSNLKIVDFPICGNIPAYDFLRSPMLNTVILRKTDTICTLENANAFNTTPFANGGSGGVVLVPSALVETYKTATNWSTLYGYGTCTFLALEDYTVDGTTTGEIDWDKLNNGEE